MEKLTNGALVTPPQVDWLPRWSLGMDKLFNPAFHDECNYLSMLGFKLIHVSERGPVSTDNQAIHIPT